MASFCTVRFTLFAKSQIMARFLERYGSRYKILKENGNELFTARFAPFHQQNEHNMLFGSVRLAVKNRNGKRWFFFMNRSKLFFKNRKRYGFWLRCRGF